MSDYYLNYFFLLESGQIYQLTGNENVNYYFLDFLKQTGKKL